MEFNKQNEVALIETGAPSKLRNPDEDEIIEKVQSLEISTSPLPEDEDKIKKSNIVAKVSSFLSHMFCCQFACRDKS